MPRARGAREQASDGNCVASAKREACSEVMVVGRPLPCALRSRHLLLGARASRSLRNRGQTLAPSCFVFGLALRARAHFLRCSPPRYYDPLQSWFSRSLGVTIGTAVGFNELLHSESAYMATEDIVDTASPWFKAAIGQAVGATKSSIVSLALVHKAIATPDALDASRLEEEWQITQNGLVEDGHDTSRSSLRLNLASVAAFVGLLPPSLRGAPLADGNKAAAVAAVLKQRLARVVARRDKEDKLVEQKRKIMRKHE